MSRISIDVTPEQHKNLKVLAALQGKSIKEYVLDRTLSRPDSEEEQAVLELEAILKDRIRKAEAGEVSKRLVSDIFEQAYRESDARSES